MTRDSFTIKIADINIGIRPRDDKMRLFCRNYISGEEPAFTVEATDRDLDDERARMIAYIGRGDASEQELEQLHIYREIAERMPDYGCFLVHAAAVRLDGDAYLFTGPSGMGKTTQTQMWKSRFGDRLRVINDDKPFLKIRDDVIMVCGSPWSGKERWHNNIVAPLKAVICLYQSDTNSIRPMKKSESWEYLLNQIYRSNDPENMQKTLEFTDRLIQLASVYSMGCNKDSEAVMVAYNAIQQP